MDAYYFAVHTRIDELTNFKESHDHTRACVLLSSMVMSSLLAETAVSTGLYYYGLDVFDHHMTQSRLQAPTCGLILLVVN